MSCLHLPAVIGLLCAAMLALPEPANAHEAGGGTHVHSEDGFLTRPYLQNVKTDGITIMWEMDAAVPMQVEYGETPEYGASAEASNVDSGFDTWIYKAVLTGLAPGTGYRYRVVHNSKALTEDRRFKTAPAGAEPFSFGVWSDSQGHNKGAYGPDKLEPTKKMIAHMAESGVDIAVTCGDLAEDGNLYADVRNYYLDRVAKFLGQEVPWFVAWGNHDKDRDAVLRKFADMPSKDRDGFDPGWGSFSFDYAGCHFICIDHATQDADIANWLEADLKSQANQEARFTFLFVHVPPYCELWIDGSEELRDTLVPLVEKYGVDAIFSGHTHEYERGYKEHVHYIITGGGSWLDWEEPVVKDWEHMFVGGAQDLPGYKHGLVNEYVRVDVDTADWRAEMHAFEPSGAYIGVLDTVEGKDAGPSAASGTDPDATESSQ